MDRGNRMRGKGLFTLFVDNLPRGVSNVWLRDLFTNGGEVMDTFVSRKSRKGFDSAFGFVRYRKESEAVEAIRKNRNVVIQGRRILVQLSKYTATMSSYLSGGQSKGQDLRAHPQSRQSNSYANALISSNRVPSTDLHRGRGKEELRISEKVGLNERSFVEGWVNRLIQRDCVEEKLFVVVGEKEMMVHGVILNHAHESKVNVMPSKSGVFNGDTEQDKRSEEQINRATYGEGKKKSCADPLVNVVMEDSERHSVRELERLTTDVLFPEIFNNNGGPDLIPEGMSVRLGSNGAINRVALNEGMGESGSIGEDFETSVKILSNRSEAQSCKSLQEYNGPWAPGYFKATGFEECRKQVTCKVGSMAIDKGKGLQSQSCKESAGEARFEEEGEGYSIGSDPSLPPGFASTIPFEVVKAAKINKRKENKMTSGKLKVKNGKDGSTSFTVAKKKNCKNTSHNPITTKAVMDFALLMGLEIEGKEIETQHQIEKILQDEKVEWEKVQSEKEKGETSKG